MRRLLSLSVARMADDVRWTGFGPNRHCLRHLASIIHTPVGQHWSLGNATDELGHVTHLAVNLSQISSPFHGERNAPSSIFTIEV